MSKREKNKLSRRINLEKDASKFLTKGFQKVKTTKNFVLFRNNELGIEIKVITGDVANPRQKQVQRKASYEQARKKVYRGFFPEVALQKKKQTTAQPQTPVQPLVFPTIPPTRIEYHGNPNVKAVRLRKKKSS